MKKLSVLFSVLAAILAVVMCVVVGINYRSMLYGANSAGYSAPPSAAFLYAIPYLAAILICVVLAVVFGKKGE